MFLYSNWMQLPINTRHTIAMIFKIPKKGSTHVVDNEIQSDGYAIKDIEHSLNVEALQSYLETGEVDMVKLWNELIWRIANPNEQRMTIEQFKEDYGEPILTTDPIKVSKKNAKSKTKKNK